MFGGYFANRVVLVTGLAGAKGTWLGWYLLEAGAARVIGLDHATDLSGTCCEASGLAGDERVTLVHGDVRDVEALTRLVAEEEVSAALHLAAMAIVGECRERPLETYLNNTAGTACFLEAVRQSGLERAVVVTTDKVYRDRGGEPWVEDHDLVATGPYAVSKACADFIARDYFLSYLCPAGQHLAIARAGNVLVPGDHHAGRIFVDVALALARGAAPVILNPAFTRPYTFVGDTLSGYLSLLARCHTPGVDGEAFNFGPREVTGVPNGELATKMCEQWGGDITWRRGSERDEPFQYQSLDWSKAAQRLDWQPTYDLDAGLREVVQWYQAHARHPGAGELRALTTDTVRRHVAAAREQGRGWADSS